MSTTVDASTGRINVECPWDIADALHWHLASIPGGAWVAKVDVEGAETREPRLVCRVGTTSESWPISAEDVPTATQVIADVIAEIRSFQERPC